MKTVAIVFAVIIVILLGILIFVQPAKGPTVTQTASSTVETGQSQTAISADGHLEVSLPHPDDVITSPVAIEGLVTGGGWFFEASFPIKVLDGNGAVIGTGQAQALSDWTSTGTVPFSASIVFTAPHYTTGTIVFSRDNPSGAIQNVESFSMPILFTASQ